MGSHRAPGAYVRDTEGIYAPRVPVAHRDRDYDEFGLDLLLEMQRSHFWYRGRHRYLLATLEAELPERLRGPASAIDLGGGCGGWIAYLRQRAPGLFDEVALGDSSRRALRLANPIVGPAVDRYQLDLSSLGWTARWDVVFLLDVLEHVADDGAVLRHVEEALRPGGLVFVTLPALRTFWSYYDEWVGHRRRYSRRDLAILARDTTLELTLARYFMFFLSPLLLVSRIGGPVRERASASARRRRLRKLHKVPPTPVNEILSAITYCESPFRRPIGFPWGTSLLGVFRKPTEP